MNENLPSIYLIDSSIYIYRAWHTIETDIVDPQGECINAVSGYTEFLFQLLTEQRPTHLVCIFDGKQNKLIRNQLYPEYKANREETPELLKIQFQRCYEFAEALGIACFVHPEYEADDLIGTLSRNLSDQGHIVIVSKDKDLAQFLFKQTDAMFEASGNNWMYHEDIYQKHGVYPDQIADFLALKGDSVDNIPGLPGIGDKTARQLINKWGNIENIFNNIHHIGKMKFRGAKKTQQTLQEQQQQLLLYRQLTGLIPCNTLPKKVSALKWQEPDLNKLLDQFRKLGFSPWRQQRWLNLIEESFL